MSKHKVLIIVGDATETVDTLYPYYRLIEGGYQPVVAAPEKRRYQMVLHEVKPGWTITKEWEGYPSTPISPFKDIKPEEYAGIFFSGGRAPENTSARTRIYCVSRAGSGKTRNHAPAFAMVFEIQPARGS